MAFITRATGLALAATAGFVLTSGVQAAEDVSSYPSKSVTLVVAKPPGGGDDAVGRALAAGLQTVLGKPVVIENVPGAAGVIGTVKVKQAAPDGYTLMIMSVWPQIAAGVLQQPSPYDIEKDLTAVARVGATKTVFLAAKSVPAKTLGEFIAYAKTKPGQLNFGSSGPGSLPHLGTELFMRQAGIQLVHVPYKGGGEAVVGLAQDQIQFYYTDLNTGVTSSQSQGTTLLAQTGSSPSPRIPNTPMVSDDFAALKAGLSFAVMGPANMPAPLVAKINEAINKTLTDPEMQKRIVALGVDVDPGSVADAAKLVREETASWTPVAKEIAAAATK